MPSTTLRLSPREARTELATALAAIPADQHLSREFPPEVEAEAAAAAATTRLPDADGTAVEYVTIDPPGSKDLDQALHLERSGTGGYRVRYAIADVPAFVTPGGAVDTEARRRGQTIYAPDGRIPLHPNILSEGAASLLPSQERSAFVWDFTLDADASVRSVAVRRERVRSRAQLDYDGAQADLDAGTASEVLQLLREVGQKRQVLEQKRGGASLTLPETEIEHDASGYHLVRRSPLPVENWNAQLSLMTGMAAASIMLEHGVGILRTMPPPEPDAISRFRVRAGALGHPWPADQPYGEYLRELDTSDPLQLAIMHAAGSLFRGAGYTAFDGEAPADAGQAAVAAPYAHATAPLRRLVDRFVLVLCEALSTGAAVPPWVREALPTLPAIMTQTGSGASQVDHRAIDTVEAALLSTRAGEVFAATVVSVNGSGGVIQLVDPPVTASCSGALAAGAHITARLLTADISTAKVQFELLPSQER